MRTIIRNIQPMHSKKRASGNGFPRRSASAKPHGRRHRNGDFAFKVLQYDVNTTFFWVDEAKGMSNMTKFVKERFWGAALLVVLLIGSSIAVKSWKARHPGAMNVLESQAMDMTVMKPPVGSVPVATEIVHLGKFSAKVTYTGSVAPLQEQVIYPRVEGYLKNLSVYNGDRVSGNQLIATVDSPDLASKVAEASAGRNAAASEAPAAKYNVARMSAERAAAQGDVQTAKSELARAQAMVKAAEKVGEQISPTITSAKANLDYWKAEIEREEKLLKSGAVSVQEFQSEKAQATAAEADYENKQAMLEEAKANVEAAKAEVAGKQSMISVANQRVAAASAALTGAGYEVRQKNAILQQAGAMVRTAAILDQYRYIRAPFAGIVTKRYVSSGQFVTPSTAIASIVQIDQVRLQANVSDKDLGSIKVGAPVVAHFTKDPNLTINARVTSVSPLADQASRTAVVEAIIPNTGHKLVPGDAVTLDIATSGNADAISVPSSAIVQKDEMSAVWVVHSEAPKGKMQYYCTMHPEIVRDKPGNCPICLMKLVPKTSDGNKKAHLVMVTTGSASGDRIEITSGLSDGDEVIYQGNTYLKEGDTVFPTQWGADGPKQMPNAPGMGDMPGMDMKSMPNMDHSKMKMDSAPKTKAAKERKIYECPMHPDQTSNNPNDLCKICGMKINQLIKKK
ncbi:MAG: efflux RND transporter periplasmic adaptor subunit [Armatimonadetes bacterium]|nr:efflux RND transporter periplasmic adaptor subunit [Armatimonadota bacterium]